VIIEGNMVSITAEELRAERDKVDIPSENSGKEPPEAASKQLQGAGPWASFSNEATDPECRTNTLDDSIAQVMTGGSPESPEFLSAPHHIGFLPALRRLPEVGRRGHGADSSRVATRLALVTKGFSEKSGVVVWSIAIEGVYDDPHKLDPFLGTGEPVVVLKDGREVAQLMPILPSGRLAKLQPDDSGRPDFRARFLEMFVAEVFQGRISVSEDLEQLRSDREL
jgi:hypothetical protein